MDIFSTAVLARVVEALNRPQSFLLDTFFPEVQTEQSEEIHFDIDLSKPTLAPFVSPVRAGQVVVDEGFQTKSLKPAYVKDKRVFDPNTPLRRAIGEQIGGNLNPAQRQEAALARQLSKMLDRLTRRQEWMASTVLRTGAVTITGDNYPSRLVDFGRAAGNTVALTSGDRWGESGVSPYDNVQTWIGTVQSNGGGAVTRVVMDPKAWELFVADPKVDKLLDYRRAAGITELQMGLVARGQTAAAQMPVYATYHGNIGNVEFWTYSQPYTDSEGATQNFMPDYTVILGGPAIEGVRAYGAIRDEAAGFQALEYFVKSWLENDPPLRMLLLQCAPLTVPYRPNASFCATVR